MKIEIEGKDTRRKIVKRSGGTGHVFVPKEWIGKEVMVVLLS